MALGFLSFLALSAGAFLLVQSQPLSAPWPMARQDAQRTGRAPYLGLQGPTDTVKWSSGATSTSSPVLSSSGSVFVLRDGALTSFDSSSGRALWSFSVCLPVNLDSFIVCPSSESPVILPDNTVVVAANYGGERSSVIFAFNGSSGRKRWNVSSDVDRLGSPAVATDSTLYFGSEGSVFALDGTSGALKWNVSVDGIASSVALSTDEEIAFVGTSDFNVYAIDTASGSLQWGFTTAGSVSSPSVGTDGTVFVKSSDGNVYALYGSNGSLVWQSYIGYTSELFALSSIVMGVYSVVVQSPGTIISLSYLNGTEL